MGVLQKFRLFRKCHLYLILGAQGTALFALLGGACIHDSIHSLQIYLTKRVHMRTQWLNVQIIEEAFLLGVGLFHRHQDNLAGALNAAGHAPLPLFLFLFYFYVNITVAIGTGPLNLLSTHFKWSFWAFLCPAAIAHPLLIRKLRWVAERVTWRHLIFSFYLQDSIYFQNIYF